MTTIYGGEKIIKWSKNSTGLINAVRFLVMFLGMPNRNDKKQIKLSPQEDVAVTKAAISDANARPLTNGQWKKVKYALTRGRVQSLSKRVKDFQE
jgi:hypothetical protein